MESKSSSSKKKGSFISYFSSPSQDTPPWNDFWYDDISDTSNNLTADSWCVNPIAKKLSMAVDSQSTIETLRTSKSSSRTVNNIPFLQPPIHSAEIDVVNTTFLYSSYIQTAGNDMSVANQPAASNVSMSQDNSLIFSTEPTLKTSALPYNNNQPADPDLWDSVFTLTSLLEVDKF